MIAGTIPACIYIRQACQRHLDGLANEVKRSSPYRFDEGKADFACRFLELLPHVKGEWARPRPGHSTLLKLEPFQVFKTCCIMGWVEKRNGLRQFSEVYLEEPRKNAKSTWAAGMGLMLGFADGEFGAEIYCGATTERQAMEVFRTALQMVKRSPDFQKYFGVEEPAVKSIYREDDASRFSPVVGNPGDGASPSAAILDELHEHATPVLLDTMRTGMGARQQPLLICITTAGSNLSGPCYAMRSDAIKVLAGQIENPNLFALIYTIDTEDDWTDPASLRKANPNFGVSVKAEFLERELRRAMNSAHLQNIFKTKHLNVWVGAATGWMNMQAWADCGDATLKLEDFRNQPCYEGDDLAARIDLASRMKVFRRMVGGQVHYYAFGRHYVPKETAMDGRHSHYASWLHQGWMVAHDGPEIQLNMIEAEIEEDLGKYKYECIAFDQYSAQQMQQSLEKKTRDGVVTTIPQTVQFLSEPMKEIEAAVLSGRFHHNCDPVFTWAMSNVVVRIDANDNIFPRKEQPDNKIDPISALINAMRHAMVAKQAGSIYSTRGILTL